MADVQIARTEEQACWQFYEHVGDRSAYDPGVLDRLSEPQAYVFALCDLRAQVNGDGFEGYFATDHGDRAPTALAAAQTVRCEEWAQLIGDAMALVGAPFVAKAADRCERIDDIVERDEDAWEDLDGRLYDLEAGEMIDAALGRYMARHAGDFFNSTSGS